MSNRECRAGRASDMDAYPTDQMRMASGGTLLNDRIPKPGLAVPPYRACGKRPAVGLQDVIEVTPDRLIFWKTEGDAG